MSKVKKIVSMFLVLTMTLAMLTFTAAVSAAEIEVVLDEYDYSIAAKLDALGVIDVVSDSELGNTMTRGEMIPILAKYLLFDESGASEATSPFLDVSAFDDNIASYRLLYNSGYIKGDNNKLFYPEVDLTYNEAITFIINAMGYEPFALRNGAYPTGYLYTANKYGLLDGLRGRGDMPIPYCDLYRIIEASLLADAVEYRYGVGEDSTEFALRDDLTILEELHGYKYISGVVTGNQYTKLLSAEAGNIGKEQIEIENKAYNTPGQDYTDLLGKYVYAYAKEADFGRYEIVYIEPVASRNEVYKISSSQILTAKVTSSRLYYEDENFKEKFYSIDSSNLKVIYNGKSRTGYGQLMNVMPSAGFVEGIDNTGDDAIDVLFVYDFANVVAGTIDTNNLKVYDIVTGAGTSLDSYVDAIRILSKSGSPIAFSNIKQGNVLSVMTSVNTGKKLVTAYVIDETVEGEITEVVGSKYIIDGKSYEIAANLQTYIASHGVSALRAGVSAKFYLDYEGKIAYYVQTTPKDLKYGVLAAMDDDTTLDPRLTFRIFQSDGKWLEANAARRLTIDGNKFDMNKPSDITLAKAALTGYTEISDVLTNSVRNYVTETKGLGWVVVYKVDEEGKINYIDTAVRNAADGELNLITAGSHLFKRSNICCNETPSQVAKDYFYDGGKIAIFKIPETSEMHDLEKYEIVSKLSGSYYNPTAAGANKITNGYAIYSLGDSDIKVATAAILRGSAATTSTGKNTDRDLRVITDITQVKDEEGLLATKIYYSQAGLERSAIANQTVGYYFGPIGQNTATPGVYIDYTKSITDPTGANLKPGDIVRMDKDANGKINFVNVIYRKTGGTGANSYIPTNQLTATTDIRNNHDGIIYGEVVKIDTTNSLISVHADYYCSATRTSLTHSYSTNSTDYLVRATTTNITVYYQSTGRMEKGTLKSIVPGKDKVFINSMGTSNHLSQADDIIVYRP